MINKVRLGGEDRPIVYNLLAIATYCRVDNISMDDFLSGGFKPDLLGLMRLTHCALAEGARKEGKDFLHPFERVSEWLEDSPEEFEKAMGFFSEAMVLRGKEKPSDQKKAKGKATKAKV